MKCQQCDRPATFHITELTGGKPQELHLCEEHARVYLNDSTENSENPAVLSAALGQNSSQPALNQASEDLRAIDAITCPICGITFFDFRSRGRLGCPNDYVCFVEQLEPLILNIHGATAHKGKIPRHLGKREDQRLPLIQLRRELEEAIRVEAYEKASELRDQIKAIEAST